MKVLQNTNMIVCDALCSRQIANARYMKVLPNTGVLVSQELCSYEIATMRYMKVLQTCLLQ